MSETVDGVTDAVKRKGEDVKQRPSKRARSESSEDDVEARILLLETEIVKSRKSYNNITTITKLIGNHDETLYVSQIASVALCRIFTRLMAAGELPKPQGKKEKDSTVSRWLRERYSEYKAVLLQLLNKSSSAFAALTLCMRMLKAEGNHMSNPENYTFPTAFLKEILKKLVGSNSQDAVRKEFCEKYLEEYDDIRFYTFAAVESILANYPLKGQVIMVDHIIDILAAIEIIPEANEELEDFYITPPIKKYHTLYSMAAHKTHAQRAWLAIMKIEMITKERRKRVLGLMTASIAPWFVKPELLMDFLSDSYDTGGSTSLLALSGLFYLIQEKNLDYPSFYRKLYSLLDGQLLHSKHRSKFFRLLDTFLASTHLPAVLVASFIKRLSRLSLMAPPAGIVAVVPWIYNLLKKHPTCTFMIHREARKPATKEILEQEGMDDPFIADEEDPMVTNAIESSLWELVTLQSHYQPNVATLAKIISEQFTKQAYNLEDFLDHSYSSILDAELSKVVKKVPIVEFEIPKRIFIKEQEGHQNLVTRTKQQEESIIEESLLVKLWDF